MRGIVIPTEKLERYGYKPYQHQLDMVAEMCNSPHRKLYNGSEQGCLSGDTVIKVATGRNGKTGTRSITLEELYRKWTSTYDLTCPRYLKSYNEKTGEFEKNQIKKVVYSGEKIVYALQLTDGKKIKVTADHEILTDSGWVELRELRKAKHKVATNGRRVKLGEVPEYGYLDKWGYEVVGFSWRNENNEARSVKKFKHRLIMEKHLGRKLKQYEHIHHINGIKNDNRISNLQLVSHSEHGKLHPELKRNIKTDKFGNKIYWEPKYTKIKSIRKLGVEKTYDIQMFGPHHNFVANGIVVHNCGKTAIAVMYANTMNLRSVLVVTVATGRINWAREYQLWSVFNNMNNQAYAVLSGADVQQLITKRAIHPGNLPSPVIVSYEMLVSNKQLQKYCLSRDWDYVVPDEFQKARTLTSQTSQIMGDLLSKAPYFMALSGTPMCNGAADLFPALCLMAAPYRHLLTEEQYKLCTDPQLYAATFTRKTVDKHGKIRYVDALNQELLRSLLVKTPPWMFRCLLTDVTEIPPVIYERIDFNLSGKTSVDADAAQCVEAFEDGETFQKPNDRRTKVMATLRAELGQQLVLCSDTYSLIEDAVEADGCVVVGTFHTEAIRVLNETLTKKGYKTSVVYGAVPPAKRQVEIDKFQRGETDVFLGQIQAAGTNINLSRAQQVIVLELDWLPTTIQQFISRLQRIGQKGKVIAKFPCSKNETHVRLLESAIRKQKAANYVIDGIQPDIGVKRKIDQKTLDAIARMA